MESLTPYLIIIIKCLITILAAILLGNGAVYFFNRMPGQWFVDYGEVPSEELLHPTEQRIKSHPWKVVFTMFFVIIGIWMVMDDERFAVAAALSMWILIELAIADVKYRIVPDQLLILLAITTLGYIPYFSSWRWCVYGALLGFGFVAMIALIGRLIYGKNTIGGGDIKMFAILGVIAGPFGILEIFVMSTLFSIVHFVILLAQKKIHKGDSQPMVPYITAAAIIYLAFLWGRAEVIVSL